MDLEGIMYVKWNESEKMKYYMISLLWGIWKTETIIEAREKKQVVDGG